VIFSEKGFNLGWDGGGGVGKLQVTVNKEKYLLFGGELLFERCPSALMGREVEY